MLYLDIRQSREANLFLIFNLNRDELDIHRRCDPGLNRSHFAHLRHDSLRQTPVHTICNRPRRWATAAMILSAPAPRHAPTLPTRLNRDCTKPAPGARGQASDIPDQGPRKCCTTNGTLLDKWLSENTGRQHASNSAKDSDRMTYSRRRGPGSYALIESDLGQTAGTSSAGGRRGLTAYLLPFPSLPFTYPTSATIAPRHPPGVPYRLPAAQYEALGRHLHRLQV